MATKYKNTPGLGSWLSHKSINQRLGIQATASIVLSLVLVAILAGTFYLRSQMQDEDNVYSDRALHSALLEKDFASLERDAFRFALRPDAENREAFESNVGDMRQAISEMRERLDAGDAAMIDQVDSLNDAYVETVMAEVGADEIGPAGTSRISEAGVNLRRIITTARKLFKLQ